MPRSTIASQVAEFDASREVYAFGGIYAVRAVDAATRTVYQDCRDYVLMISRETARQVFDEVDAPRDYWLDGVR